MNSNFIFLTKKNIKISRTFPENMFFVKVKEKRVQNYLKYEGIQKILKMYEFSYYCSFQKVFFRIYYEKNLKENLARAAAFHLFSQQIKIKMIHSHPSHYFVRFLLLRKKSVCIWHAFRIRRASMKEKNMKKIWKYVQLL